MKEIHTTTMLTGSSWTGPGDADLPRGYSKIIDPVSGKEYYVVDDGSKEEDDLDTPRETIQSGIDD